MITYLQGNLETILPTHAILDVQGVGYLVHIPKPTYEALTDKQNVSERLLIHEIIKEEEHTLYGFYTEEEREMFRLLIKYVEGVGPKSALAILNGSPLSEFKNHVAKGNSAALAKLKGIGAKTAERIVLELRDKVGISALWEAQNTTNSQDNRITDAVLALLALGYTKTQAEKAAQSAQKTNPDATSEQLIRASLKLLS
jgi:Holliday junction DNA helicase RuvA